MNRQQQMARDRAVQTLQHYVSLLMRRTAGGSEHPANGDTMIEIEGIVDDIIAAATPPALSDHAERVASAMTSPVDGPDPRD